MKTTKWPSTSRLQILHGNLKPSGFAQILMEKTWQKGDFADFASENAILLQIGLFITSTKAVPILLMKKSCPSPGRYETFEIHGMTTMWTGAGFRSSIIWICQAFDPPNQLGPCCNRYTNLYKTPTQNGSLVTLCSFAEKKNDANTQNNTVSPSCSETSLQKIGKMKTKHKNMMEFLYIPYNHIIPFIPKVLVRSFTCPFLCTLPQTASPSENVRVKT